MLQYVDFKTKVDVNNKLFMTNVAKQSKNKTKADEFEAVQLSAPDVLRMRLEMGVNLRILTKEY